MRKISAHTILFTEACPLNCRYCNLRDSTSYGTSEAMARDEVMAEVEQIYQTADRTVRQELLLTGGEPFLFPNLIKEIVHKYGNFFRYHFNTSGLLLTEDILELLSHYETVFTLSVDGDEALTNYLRPLRSNPWGVGYMKQFREILPVLLYYFPDTPFRIIVGPRYVDKLHEMYLYAEQLGFRYFTYIIDFECRPGEVKNNNREWTEEDTKKLTFEVEKIAAEIVEGWKQGYSRPLVTQFVMMAKDYLKGTPFSPDCLRCQLFSGTGRTSTTMYTKDRREHCMSDSFEDMGKLKEAVIKRYEECGGKCPIDPDCQAFDYCSKGCIKDNYDHYKDFFHLEFLSCQQNKADFQGMIDLLVHANQECQDSKFYRHFLWSILEEEDK